MLEATIKEASLLKKLLEAVKDLVTDANFDCSGEGISLQAMDGSHVSLVTMLLRKDGFEFYRCDRSIVLGINLVSMTKILKCAGNDDRVTIKAAEDGDRVTFVFESPKNDKISEFELKLITIDGETLQIPETEHSVVVNTPSGEFQKICRDLISIGDTVEIDATKEGVRFSTAGDVGMGTILVKQSSNVDDEKDKKKNEITSIQLQEPVKLTFALRYLGVFTKATPLSSTVSLSMSRSVPLMVEYPIEEMGYLRFYLAPKIEEE